ncbi:leucine-rich repeat-containing protein 58-like isoform X1 [Ptychodera flava]|uniref:leucine-rich repeat-containing protein 58-like isoform X1 n=1 Tax=Ptychodera flava TaxID=63121 RepID=UPI00396A5946
MAISIGSYVSTLLADSIFHTGDVQATSIAVVIVGMLSFSLVCLLVSLIFGKPPATSAKKKTASTVPLRRASSCRLGRRPSMVHVTHKKGVRLGRAPKQTKQVILSCREVPKQFNNVPCTVCNIVAAKKTCRYARCGACCRANKASICHAHGTGGTAAQGIVEGACDDKPVELDLSYLNLKNCPDRIGYVGAQLVSLNLSNNRIHSLPEEIGFLRGLEELFLQYNCLTEIPESIGNLEKLEELDCKNNRIKKLPNSLGNMVSLNILNVTNNMLQTFPRSIGKCVELEELCAHSNQLTELPDEISNLVNLTTLYLGENRLSELPKNIGNLVRLAELDVSSCELVYLPDSLSRCTSLVRVWLSSNKLKAVPDQMGRLNQLKELHVRNNQIMYFPASLLYLQLYTFSANHNALIDEWNMEARQAITVEPTDDIPPLLELAARTLVKHDVHWTKDDLPLELVDMLVNARQCSSCEGPFFKHYKSEIVFSNVGVFHRVPLYQQICSPYTNTHCQPVDTR